jgi:hypothetical protein
MPAHRPWYVLAWQFFCEGLSAIVESMRAERKRSEGVGFGVLKELPPHLTLMTVRVNLHVFREELCVCVCERACVCVCVCVCVCARERERGGGGKGGRVLGQTGWLRALLIEVATARTVLLHSVVSMVCSTTPTQNHKWS